MTGHVQYMYMYDPLASQCLTSGFDRVIGVYVFKTELLAWKKLVQTLIVCLYVKSYDGSFNCWLS